MDHRQVGGGMRTEEVLVASINADEGGKERCRRGGKVQDVMRKGLGFDEDFRCWEIDRGHGSRYARPARGLGVEGYLVARF